MYPLSRRPRFAALLGAAGLGASAFAGAAFAEPAPSFPDLLSQSQETAPRLAEARADIDRAEGLALQARVFPNPTLGFQVENFNGGGPFQGTSRAETTGQVQQMLELGGKRRARIAAGSAEVQAAEARARRAQVDYAYDLAAAYAAAEASDRRLELAKEQLGLAEEDAGIATSLVEAGREAELRRLQSQAAVQAARASVDEAQAARATAFGALTALSGATAPLTSIPASLLDRAPAVFATVAPTPEATVAYQAAEAERAAADRRVTIERRRAIPDVTVSLGIRRFEDEGATAMIAGVQAPFPLFDRNRGNVAAARAEVATADARVNAARLDAEAAIRANAARILSAETRLTAAGEGQRTAQEAYRLARVGYEAGKLSLVELVNARRALADARSQTIAAAEERVGARASQARLGGFAAPGEQQ